MEAIADFLEGAGLVVFEAEAQPDNLALLAVEVAERRHQIGEIGPVKQRKQFGRKREGAGLIREDVHHRLPDPPDRVGNELHISRWIEAARRFDQTEVSFVNEIEEVDAEAAISLRVR